jgi:hypothetical protein
MPPHLLLVAGVARQTAPSLPGQPAPAPFAEPVHSPAALTDAEARQLNSRPALFRVVVGGEPDGDAQRGWRYDCRGDGPACRSLWLPDGDDLVAEAALQGNGLLLVDATLRRIVSPRVTGTDSSGFPGLVEYRPTRARLPGPRGP